MSPFWSTWIQFLVVLNLGITLFLFIWAIRVRIPTKRDGTTGHVWAHGVLREGVRKLPLWWVLFSAAMFGWGFIYLALYPGFGSFQGLLGWTSQDELRAEVAANEARLQAAIEPMRGRSVEELARHAFFRQTGRRLFLDNCAACHGRAAQGQPAIGAPALNDDVWLYGGDGATILASILDGRGGVMAPFGAVFGEEGVTNLAHYVLSLSGAPHDEAKAAAGRPLFATCAACHGPQGKGNPALGAPNLTDDVWLYGGDLATVTETIRDGRSGKMPAWRGRLGEDEARAVAAWVYAQANDVEPDRVASASRAAEGD
ncbi:MAG TPA: cytochrome-c oxidase, cbb3-type subunit III [Pseudomonadales bacterium]